MNGAPLLSEAWGRCFTPRLSQTTSRGCWNGP